MSPRRLIGPVVAAVALMSPLVALAAEPPNDAFIAGYAAAVMERELSMKAGGLHVSGGHVEYDGPAMSPEQQAQLVKVLSSVPGVKDVTVLDGSRTPVPAQSPIEQATPRLFPPSSSQPTNTSTDKPTDATGGGAAIDGDDQPLTLYLGAGRTFSPLLADPRWPHFFASFNYYSRDTSSAELQGAGSVGFGETISFVRKSYPSGFKWEAGLQAAVFAVFDFNSNDSASTDLINADYFVGPYFALRQGNFSLLARLYHQSSHLGDEFILRGDAPVRQNFSFETINLIASYDLPNGFRVYGGGGYIFDIDPENNHNNCNIEYGVEWISPTTIPGARWARPVAAIDVQHREIDDYHIAYSVRGGIQLEDPTRFTQRMQIMLEYYDGNSPNGQLYDEHVRYFGIGAHFYF